LATSVGAYLFIAFAALMCVACAYAWWRGGTPERVASAMFLVAWLASIATDQASIVRYRQVQINYLLVDFALLVGLLMLTRASHRRWTAVAAALQTLVVLAHVARALSPHQWASVYMIMTASWPYLQLLVLIAGITAHWRRTRTRGAASSLPSSFEASPAPIPLPSRRT
jgi:hypothetical protein